MPKYNSKKYIFISVLLRYVCYIMYLPANIILYCLLFSDEVTEELNKAIDARLEGIVIKNPNSIYKPNTRKDGGWLKVKPDYIDNLMDELDLLIIGGYYGEGRRSTFVSHFLLAVSSPEKISKLFLFIIFLYRYDDTLFFSKILFRAISFTYF